MPATSIVRFEFSPLFSRSYDRLLASSCRPSVVRLSVCL